MSDTISSKTADQQTAETALVIVGRSEISLWSLKLDERIRRQFAKTAAFTELDVDNVGGHGGDVLLVRGDCVIDQPLVGVMQVRRNFLLLEQAGQPASVLAAHVSPIDVASILKLMRGEPAELNDRLSALAPHEIDAGFWKALRKRETPYAMRVTKETQVAVEWRMFMGTYKGATDIVTKHVWPRPAFHVTRWLAQRGVTPNMVTSVAAVATVLAFFLFLRGAFLWGLAAAWLMTFLDTVDGKLARTTLTSSKWGDVFDHGIDLVHPPFWYVAWALGLGAAGFVWSHSLFWWTTGLILGGYVLQRVMEGIAIKWLGLEIHIWRPIDTLFRQVTARRNSNLVLLTIFATLGRPDLGLLAVAAWTVACLVLHGLQLVQAFAAKKVAGPPGLQSWMRRP